MNNSLIEKKLYLVFINYKGRDYTGKNIYEFCYASSTELDQESLNGWDAIPAMGLPKVPIDDIVQVCEIEVDFTLELIQNSTTLSIWDAIEGVIAMGYENINGYDILPQTRLHFHFGETIQQTKKTLLTRECEFTNAKIIS